MLQALEKVKATPESVACELMDELEELLGTRLSTEFDDHRKTSSSAPPAGSAGPSAASPTGQFQQEFHLALFLSNGWNKTIVA